jgi:hypothetical protein
MSIYAIPFLVSMVFCAGYLVGSWVTNSINQCICEDCNKDKINKEDLWHESI